MASKIPRRLAILAPHLVMPARIGCDIYIANKYAALPSDDWSATMIAADGIYHLREGLWEIEEACPNTMQSRVRIAQSMLFAGKDYLSAKFNSSAYLKLCEKVNWADFDRVIASFTTTEVLIRQIGIDSSLTAIETHNFDPKLYLDRALEQRGVKRVLAQVAAMRAQGVLKSLPANIPVFALGPADRCLFEGSGFTRVIETGLGHETHPPRTVFPSESRCRIAFVGALSTEMNVAALRDFIETHLARLAAAVSSPLDFLVAGSNPSSELRRYLKARNIELLADAPQEALYRAVQSCHATILPFPAANGLKLKFAMSTSLGVPVLGFIAPPDDFAGMNGVVHSQSMAVWGNFLTRLLKLPGAQKEAARVLQAASARLGWSDIVRRDMRAIDDFQARPAVNPSTSSSTTSSTTDNPRLPAGSATV